MNALLGALWITAQACESALSSCRKVKIRCVAMTSGRGLCIRPGSTGTLVASSLRPLGLRGAGRATPGLRGGKYRNVPGLAVGRGVQQESTATYPDCGGPSRTPGDGDLR
jgi:hypothetical protein